MPRATLAALLLLLAGCAWYPTPYPERQDFHSESEYETWRLRQASRSDPELLLGRWQLSDDGPEVLDFSADGTYLRYDPAQGPDHPTESGGYLLSPTDLTLHAQIEDPTGHRNQLYTQPYRLQDGLLRLGDSRPLGRLLSEGHAGGDYERR